MTVAIGRPAPPAKTAAMLIPWKIQVIIWHMISAQSHDKRGEKTHERGKAKPIIEHDGLISYSPGAKSQYDTHSRQCDSDHRGNDNAQLMAVCCLKLRHVAGFGRMLELGSSDARRI